MSATLSPSLAPTLARRCASLLAAFVVAACVRGGDPAPVTDHARRLPPNAVAPAWVAPLPTRVAAPRVRQATAPVAPVRVRVTPAPITPVQVQVAATPAPPARVTVAPARVAALSPRSRAPEGVHRVEPGDTVYNIARRYGLSTRAIIAANGLSAPYVLSLGRKLAVPAPRLHRVAAGETIYGISRRYDIDMTTLVRLNAVTAPYRIAVGQQLVLPGDMSAAHPTTRKGAAPVRAARVAMAGPLPQRKPARPAALRAYRPIGEPPPLAEGGFAPPIEGRVVSAYGAKVGGVHNDGINIAAPRGAAVRAAQSGVVAYAGSEIRGYGNLLLIKHAEGLMTAYAHADRLLVARGEMVERGQVIATVGTSGGVEAPQLHFEIRRGAKAVDPRTYLVSLGG
ncbi:MAG: peptidoglycan DD-metalloendopeptidase family protein [Alphaproteobacteria bacterium]